MSVQRDGDAPGADRPRSGPFDRRLLAEFPAIRLGVAASVALGLVSTATVVVQAVALAHLLAGAMPGAHPGDRVADLAWLAGAAAVRALAALAAEALARLGAVSAKGHLRRALLAATLAGAPAGGAAPGGVATLAGRGLDALDAYVGRCLPDLVLAAVAPVAMVVAVGVLDWPSAIVLLAAAALFPVFGALVGRASMGLAARRWRQVEALGRQIADVFQGLPVLRAFGRSAAQRERIARASESLRDASLKTLRVALLSALVLDTLGSVSVALVAVPLGLRLLTGSVPLSAALAVLILAPEVVLPFRRASAEFHESTEGLAAAGRALSAIEDYRDVRRGAARTAGGGERRVTPVPDPAAEPVALRAVRLDLPGRSVPVLDEATLVISPGETVALIGPNGAGKSSVASLLLGFLAPDRGSVAVGPVDLADLDLRAWRRLVAYLPERPSLLAGTLADNLRLADAAASDDRLLAALRLAGASELVAELPDGLATRLGEGGRAVSAGERQRIALARTLLRPASLYVLDEPTVHLDEAAEARVLETLGRTLAGRSALVITHRPAVLGIADRVVALADGGFVPVAPGARAARGPGPPAAGRPAPPEAGLHGAPVPA